MLPFAYSGFATNTVDIVAATIAATSLDLLGIEFRLLFVMRKYSKASLAGLVLLENLNNSNIMF
jgi:hypothetical protein